MNPEFKQWLEQIEKYVYYTNDRTYNRLWIWDDIPSSFFKNIPNSFFNNTFFNNKTSNK
jgi:hypothetical protein